MRKNVVLTIVVAGLIFVAGWTTHQSKAAPAKQAWEYTMMYGYSEKEFNQMGADGWELVAATHVETREQHFYFKRAK